MVMMWCTTISVLQQQAAAAAAAGDGISALVSSSMRIHMRLYTKCSVAFEDAASTCRSWVSLYA
jgi:hypothetical protein